jgi:hypothetical protein
MAKYIATRPLWLSHECRLVGEGEEFEAVFPEGMKLSDNIKLLDKPKAKKSEPESKPDESALV